MVGEQQNFQMHANLAVAKAPECVSDNENTPGLQH